MESLFEMKMLRMYKANITVVNISLPTGRSIFLPSVIRYQVAEISYSPNSARLLGPTTVLSIKLPALSLSISTHLQPWKAGGHWVSEN